MQVSYGFGSIAFGIGGVPLSSSLLMLYFNQVIGVEAVLVGVAIMVSVSVDAFTDPLIAWVSDRRRAPFGRRHTLMYISALPAALGFFLMWHAPSGLSPGALLAFMIAMLVLVNISISLYEVPSLAPAPEPRTGLHAAYEAACVPLVLPDRGRCRNQRHPVSGFSASG
jgi:GPH family glycoside/pentoside/hexuronide:cation symporter